MLQLILFGWADNFSLHGPEHSRIGLSRRLLIVGTTGKSSSFFFQQPVLACHVQYMHKRQANLCAENNEDH
jgi:hypothetical protein